MKRETVQNWILIVALLLAVFTFDYLDQAGTMRRFGVTVAAFFSPFFIYRVYLLLWVRRERLKEHYEMASTQFAVIKARRNKK